MSDSTEQHVERRTKHYMFVLSRPGLKVGYEIPLRLRVVDSLNGLLSIVVVCPILVGVMVAMLYPLCVLRFWDWSIESRVQFYFLAVVVGFPIFSLFLLGICNCWIRLFSFLCRVTGVLSAEEAEGFLQMNEYYGKRRFKPWPDSWQQPVECEPIRAEWGNDDSNHHDMSNM